MCSAKTWRRSTVGRSWRWAASEQEVADGGGGLGGAEAAQEGGVDAVDLGLCGVAGFVQPALGPPGPCQEPEGGRVGRAVEGVHLPGRLLDRVPVVLFEGGEGLPEEGVPAGRAVARQPDRRLDGLPVAQVDLGDDQEERDFRPAGDLGQAVEGRGCPQGQALAGQADRPRRLGVAAVVVLSAAGPVWPEGGAERLAFAHRRHPGRDVGGFEQWPVVAGVDHQEVGVELEGPLDGRHQGAEGFVGARQIDDLVAPSRRPPGAGLRAPGPGCGAARRGSRRRPTRRTSRSAGAGGRGGA